LTNILQDHIKKTISVDTEKLQLLADFFEQKVFAKKETLLSEGKTCREIFFVAKGCLQIYFVKPNGLEQTIDFAIENWWTSDFMAFLKHTPATFSIKAVEKTNVFILSNSSQQKLLTEIPEMETYFRLIFQRAYAASQRRVRLLYEFSREDLYLQFSKNYPDFIQRVPQYLLASFLGFTPEYLSEIRKKNIS